MVDSVFLETQKCWYMSDASTETVCLVDFHKICLQNEKGAGKPYWHVLSLKALVVDSDFLFILIFTFNRCIVCSLSVLCISLYFFVPSCWVNNTLLQSFAVVTDCTVLLKLFCIFIISEPCSTCMLTFFQSKLNARKVYLISQTDVDRDTHAPLMLWHFSNGIRHKKLFLQQSLLRDFSVGIVLGQTKMRIVHTL